MSNQRDTIFALSSGRPPAAIAVVRVSGPAAGDAIMALAGRVPQPRQATLLRLKIPCSDEGSGHSDSAYEPIDDALVLWFPGPRSETGEDTAEFQLHGGYAVVAAVLSALGTVEGLRPAGPGEFTRRAFENGKLDLTRVEGLADLIGAETEAQRRQAFAQLKGLLGDRAERWRRRLTEALALVEASIDFPDEDVVSEKVIQPALAMAKELEQEIRDLLADSHRGERLREGLTIAVAGPVNVGKSSIVNRLAKRSAAIVSPHAGTTRDIIEVHLDLGGFPVTILDSAGMRETDNPVEEEGVRRARARAEASDLVLWVSISALTGAAFDDLVGGLAEHARQSFTGGAESALVTRQRHRTALADCAEALRRACAEEASGREDIIAEELRLAARALGRLIGRVDVENVLDVIFRDFCIGK